MRPIFFIRKSGSPPFPMMAKQWHWSRQAAHSVNQKTWDELSLRIKKLILVEPQTQHQNQNAFPSGGGWMRARFIMMAQTSIELPSRGHHDHYVGKCPNSALVTQRVVAGDSSLTYTRNNL